MLARLYIKNYGLFEETEITFEQGLNILTGETGAGKSLLIGAIGLLMGKRVDSSAIFLEDSKTIIEGEFRHLAAQTQRRLESLEAFDLDAHLIIRREVSASGKSRSFINDTPVSLQVMRSASEFLIDLHGQHENQSLLYTDHQLELLDAYGDLDDQVITFGEKLKASNQLLREMRKLQAQEARMREQHQFVLHQVQELEEAQLQEGEEEQLEQELKLLEHATSIQEALSFSVEHLYQQDQSLYTQLSEVTGALQKLGGISPEIERNLQNLIEAQNILKECAFSLQDQLDNIENDPERLSFIEERLSVYHELKRKYGQPTGAALMEKLTALQQEIQTFSSIESDIQQYQEQHSQTLLVLAALGLEIEKRRLEVKSRLEGEINQFLTGVGFNQARFFIHVGQNRHPEGSLVIDGERVGPLPTGINKVYFEVQTNPGVPAGPLAQIASGGEISRIMLALKAALAEKAAFPILIFDEIDTGISGEIANKVGSVMEALGARHQILAITHLPQIAAKGQKHYKIAKSVAEGRTVSSIVPLDKAQRVKEIAELLGGESPSASALQHAEDLLS